MATIKVGLIAEIQGNLPALEAVLGYIHSRLTAWAALWPRPNSPETGISARGL